MKGYGRFVMLPSVQRRERAWPSCRLGSWLRVIFTNDGTAPAVFGFLGEGYRYAGPREYAGT